MLEIVTKRLVIKSDASVLEGEIVFPPTPPLDILNIDIRNERNGFAIYLKENPSIQVGQFGFRNDRYPYELAYETIEEYRRNHYMQEAMEAFIDWFFKNVKVDCLYGIIASGNIPSFKLAMKLGFEETGKTYGQSKLFKLSKNAILGKR